MLIDVMDGIFVFLCPLKKQPETLFQRQVRVLDLPRQFLPAALPRSGVERELRQPMPQGGRHVNLKGVHAALQRDLRGLKSAGRRS